MSTPLQSAAQPDSVGPAQAVVRRSRAGGTATPEVYGAENLPILIRLPNLLPSSATPRQPLAAETPAEANPATDAGVSEGDPEKRTVASPTQRRGRRPGAQQRARILRRQAGHLQAPGWLRGIGQLALAAILAGVLLAIIVTIKNWNAEGAYVQHSADLPYADAPEFDLGGPILEPAASVLGPALDAEADQIPMQRGPDLGPPTMTRAEEMFRDVFPADMPAATSGAAAERAAPADARLRLAREIDPLENARDSGIIRQPTTTYPYPSTGVEPVATSRPATVGRDAAASWSETLHVSPVQNAQRPLADPPYRH